MNIHNVIIIAVIIITFRPICPKIVHCKNSEKRTFLLKLWF